jgi:hypothetical protein
MLYFCSSKIISLNIGIRMKSCIPSTQEAENNLGYIPRHCIKNTELMHQARNLSQLQSKNMSNLCQVFSSIPKMEKKNLLKKLRYIGGRVEAFSFRDLEYESG